MLCWIDHSAQLVSFSIPRLQIIFGAGTIIDGRSATPFNGQHSASIDANTAAKRGRIGADPTTQTRPELPNSPTLANPHRRTTGGRIPSLLRLCSSELE